MLNAILLVGLLSKLVGPRTTRATAEYVLHGHVVSATEPIAIVPANTRWHIRMAEFIAVIYVWATMIIDILSCSFNAIVKALALYIAELLGRLIPSARPRSLSISGRRTLRRSIVLRN
jgi:hypothetical protein